MEDRVYSPDWPSPVSIATSLSRSPSPLARRPYLPATAPPPPPPPLQQRRRTQHTSRDQRLQVHTLHTIGLNQTQIAYQLNITRRQVQYAQNHPSTPSKRSGRRSKLTEQEVEHIIQWVCASSSNRRCPWERIPQKLGLDTSYYTVRYALRKAGFSRRLARRKPPISEKNRQTRLEFAREYRDWTPEQWKSILWTDETWQTGGHHTRTWVTRRSGEEFDPTCVIKRVQRRVGWMFWGSFSGTTKGPALFWEKDWGTITSESYQERVVPLIQGWINQRRQQDWAEELILMQDNAPSHNARDTLRELAERFVRVLEWPPYSPDLNPIESVWNWMKHWIQDHYGEEITGEDAIRTAVWEAWNALPESYLQELVESMPARCQAVIDANGMHIPY
jgi:transposase